VGGLTNNKVIILAGETASLAVIVVGVRGSVQIQPLT
jgi:hypothetical protein